MDKDQYDKLGSHMTLTNADWHVSKASRYNSGSETLAHSSLKHIVGHYLTHECGYRVAFEVEMPQGEVDVLGYSTDDIIIVECETSPTDDVIQEKLDKYVHGEPPRDMFLLNVNDSPANIFECYEWVAEEIGL